MRSKRQLSLAVLIVAVMAAMVGPSAAAAQMETRASPIESNPHVYAIFWGSNWGRGEAAIKRAKLETMYNLISNSDWAGTLSQYWGPAGQAPGGGETTYNFVSKQLSLSSYLDNSPGGAPSNVTRTAVETEVKEAVVANGWPQKPTVNDQFVVFTPPGTSYSAGFVGESAACGWHSGGFNATIGSFVFDFVAWAKPDTGQECGHTYVAAHEYAEAAVEPFYGESSANGWKNHNVEGGGEVADLCGESGSVTLAPEIIVPTLWDNERETCSSSHSAPAQKAPELLLQEPSNVGPTSATLRASPKLNGMDPDYYYFQWGESTGYGKSTNAEPAFNLRFGANAKITGLTPATTYHFRLVVGTEGFQGKTLYGPDGTFKTPDAKPVVTTGVAEEAAPKTYRLKGTVDPRGMTASYRFEYGIGSLNQVTGTKTVSGTGAQAVQIDVPNLKGLSNYKYRLVAWTEVVIKEAETGETKEFSTPDWRPVVTTEPPSGVKDGGATLNGTVNPTGLATTYQFEWGPTTDYGSFTPPLAAEAGAGTAPVAVSRSLSALPANTLYHYRLRATNADGTVFGADRTFEIHPPRFDADAYPATMTIAQDPSSKLEIGTSGGSVSCGQATLTSTASAGTATLSSIPSLSECEAFHGLAGTITTNGCAYVVHAGSYWLSGYAGTLDIACPAGKAIEIAAGTCRVQIPSQSGLSALRFNPVPGSAPKPSVAVKANVSRLSYTVTQDGFLCPFAGTGAREDGTITGAANMTAANAGGAMGAYVSGEEDVAPVPSFEAEEYPATLTAAQDSGNKLTFGTAGGTVSCASASASGSLAAASAAGALAPTYSECEAFSGLTGTIATNGCSYVLHGGKRLALGKYSGSLDIACPEGKSLEIAAGTCSASIPAQTGLAAELLDTTQSGRESVSLVLKGSAMRYTVTQDGFLCPFAGTGTHEDGTFTGSATITAAAEQAAKGVRVGG
jgi:hypothetical protein